MKREHEYIEPIDPFVLTMDCPLNNSILDISGNNNHLTAVSGGTPVFVNDPTDASIKVGQYNTDLQGLIMPINTINFINKCKIELDFYKYNTWSNVSYPNLIDSYGSGAHSGIVWQKVGTTIHIGLNITNPSYGYVGLQVNVSTILVDTWYHFLFENNNNSLHLLITKKSDNSVIHDYTAYTPTILSSPYPKMYIGRSIYYTGRTWGGYIKNFKLYIYNAI